MVHRLRTSLVALLLVALAGGLVAACGGEDEAASQDVNALLRETFSGDKQIDSGNVKLAVELDPRGSRRVTGPLNLSLAGPFESTGKGTLPKFELTLRFAGAGQQLQAGAISTGDKGFVSFQNRDYALAPQVFRQFKAGFEEAQAKQRGGRAQSLATLGIDPRRWLRNPRNAGEAKVGDEDTIKITGGVDVPKLLADVDRALQRAGSLGGGAGRLPDRLTPAQTRQVQRAVKALDVEIHTGAEDKILRRMRIAMDLRAPTRGDDLGLDDANVRFDLTITGVNEDQDIEEPENPRPFEELTRQLGGLGFGLGGGSGSGTGGSGAGSASSSRALERYSDCIRRAGSDATEAQKCADLLTP